MARVAATNSTRATTCHNPNKMRQIPPPQEPDLFTIQKARLLAEAEAAAERGIRRSAEHSGDEWAGRALEFLRTYLLEHEEMFVDDLWDAGLEEPESLRALGAVIKKAADEGWMQRIRAGEDYRARPSKRSNMQLKPVWRSLIYRKPTATAATR